MREPLELHERPKRNRYYRVNRESIETSVRFQKEPSGAGERFKGSRVSYERATREQEEDK